MHNVAKKKLAFHEIRLTAIQQNGQIWFTASDIAKALQYSSDDAVSRIYRRNQSEFSVGMSETVKLTVSGNCQKTVRIFNLRGAHLLSMFARTPVAKEFRRWVLDILDRESLSRASPIEQKLVLACPDCGSQSRFTHISILNREETNMHSECTNKSCAHVYLVTVKHQYQIEVGNSEVVPSVRQLIESLSENEKTYALGLLLRQ